MKKLTYDPLAGTTIDHACKEATALAIRKSAEVTFDFNGITLTATPDSSPADIQKDWKVKLEKEREEYRASPEYTEDEKRRVEEISSNQSIVNHFMETIEQILATCSTDDLMESLKKFTLAADNVGVKFDNVRLVTILESAGHKEHAHVGRPPSDFDSKEVMAQYIIGQVINFLRSGMPPHPVTVSFIEKYFALKE